MALRHGAIESSDNVEATRLPLKQIQLPGMLSCNLFHVVYLEKGTDPKSAQNDSSLYERRLQSHAKVHSQVFN